VVRRDHDSGARSGSGLAFGAALIAAGLLTCAALGWAGRARTSFLLAALGCLCLAPYVFAGTRWFCGSRGGFDVFAPVFIYPAFFFAVYVVGSLSSVHLYPEVLTRAHAYSLVGVSVYYGGLGLATPRLVLPVALDGVGKPGVPVASWSRARTQRCLLLLCAAGALAVWRIFDVAGVPILASDVAVARVAALKRASAYVVFLAAGLNIALPVALAVAMERRMGVWRVWAVTGAVSLCMLALGGRGLALTPYPIMIVIHHYMRRRIPVARLFVIAILVLSFGAGYEYARQTRSFRYGATEALWHDTGVRLLQKVWLAGTKQFRVKFATYERVLETFPEEHPLMLGRGVGMTLSTVAPGSQQNFGEYLQEYWGETSVGWGLPPTVVGGLYLDFGLGGVVCGMAAIGYILQRVYLRMRGSGRSTHVFLYAVVLTTAVKQIFGGAFVADVKPLWYLGLTVVILLACATRPARSSAGGAQDHAFEVDPRRISPAGQAAGKG